MTVGTDQSDPKSVIPGRSHVWGTKCHVWARPDMAQSGAVKGWEIPTFSNGMMKPNNILLVVCII